MKRVCGWLICALLAAHGVATTPAAAEVLDMGSYTCRDLLQEDEETIGLVLMWADGYISAETEDLTMDKEWIMELATTIGDACSIDPEIHVIDIVEKIVRDQKQ